MTHHWDEFSKSLAEESLPRRESLRRLGLVFAGGVLSPLGLGTALARGSDPCKPFCNRCPKSQRSSCLAACNACNKDPSRLCGTCGSYVCCGSGRTCCSGYCTTLADDVLNCGACGFVCDPPGPNEYGACIGGECTYVCAEGAVDCDGTCTFLDWDPDNCGACGNVCPASAPVCVAGACIASTCTPSCPPGWCGGDGCGGECACPSGWVCESNWCYYADTGCPPPTALCNGVCVNIGSDSSNCGACGNVCPSGFACINSACSDPACQFVEC
jgi:hypothetical protein